MKQANQQGSRRRQQRQDQQCRQPLYGKGQQLREDSSFAGFGRGSGNCRNQQPGRFRSGSDMSAEPTPIRSGLQLLREQVERLTKALEEIQTRIRFDEKQ